MPVVKSELGFYVSVISAALVGTAIAELLRWSNEAVFAAGMIPFALVMLVFILREPRDAPRPLTLRQRPAHRRG